MELDFGLQFLAPREKSVGIRCIYGGCSLIFVAGLRGLKRGKGQGLSLHATPIFFAYLTHKIRIPRLATRGDEAIRVTKVPLKGTSETERERERGLAGEG